MDVGVAVLRSQTANVTAGWPTAGSSALYPPLFACGYLILAVVSGTSVWAVDRSGSRGSSVAAVVLAAAMDVDGLL